MAIIKAAMPVLAFGIFIYVFIIFVRIAEYIEAVKTYGWRKAWGMKFFEIPYGQKDTDDY